MDANKSNSTQNSMIYLAIWTINCSQWLQNNCAINNNDTSIDT